MQSVKIFYSYAHADEFLRNELEKHLSILKQQGFITEWYDRNISAGTEWAREINTHLNTAQIILLLVSPDFLASQYCYSIEMTRAMERHNTGEAYVIPVILRAIDWRGAPFDKLQMLPTDAKPVTGWSDRDAAFVNVAVGIRKAVEKLSILPLTTHFERTASAYQSELSQPYEMFSSPYRGLFAFREQDAPFFFGRETFSEQLLENVRKKPFVAVIGPSGCGKSSLVFAGLLPRLHYEGTWRIASMRPSDRPFRALAVGLLPLLEPQMDEIDRLARINKLAEPLQQSEILLYDIIERIMQKQNIARLLLFIDQFEELYTLCWNVEDRQRFLNILLETVHAVSRYQKINFTLIITLRADFLGQVLLYRPFAEVLQYNDVKLSPMKRQELYDVIEKPAKQLNITIEEGLTERIVHAVSQEPGNLPLLEFTLALLWTKQQGAALKHVTYDEIGGVEQALATYAEELYATFTLEEQQMTRRIFSQLVYPGEGTEDTRRIATRTQIGEEAWRVIMSLSDARLVICGQDETTSEETVEIVHEALISGWKRLRQWIEHDREFRSWQERLRAALRQWNKSQRDDGALLHGVLLAEARQWMTQKVEDISKPEQLFIELSQQFLEKETQRWKILYEEAEQRRKFELLYGAGEELSKINYLMQIDQAYAFIAQIAEKQRPCYIAVYRYNDSAEELVLRYISTGQLTSLLSDGKEDVSLHTLVAKERHTLVVSGGDNILSDVSPLKFAGLILDTFVIAPILFGDHYYGNIMFFYPDIDRFRKSDVDVFEGLAQQLASTIYRLRMTENRQGESAQQALSLLERDRISEIISDLVHSLGNDLGLVGLQIRNVLEELEGQEKTSDTITKNLNYISKSVSRALKSISNVKNITLGEALVEESVIIQPKELLEEACGSIPLSTNILMSPLEMQEDVPPIRGIRSLIIDILHNLILNAIQAMPTGGRLVLKVRNENRFVAIEVIDTGVGIPPEQLSQIFDLSFSTKGSTGFGLWSAVRNAHRNHGKLEVESQVGLGTTFTLLLPKADKEAP